MILLVGTELRSSRHGEKEAAAAVGDDPVGLAGIVQRSLPLLLGALHPDV